MKFKRALLPPRQELAPELTGQTGQQVRTPTDIAYANTRRIANKFVDLKSIAVTHKPYVIIIIETWLRSDICENEITRPEYRIHCKDWACSCCCVAILFQESLQVVSLTDMRGIECFIYKVK